MVIINLTWADAGNGEIECISAQEVNVSGKSAALNLATSKKMKHPKYIQVSEINKYLDESTSFMTEKEKELLSSNIDKEVEKQSEPVLEKPKQVGRPKLEKPTFKTVEEKQTFEAEQKDK